MVRNLTWVHKNRVPEVVGYMSAYEQYERNGFGMNMKAMGWERIKGLMCTDSKQDPLNCLDCPRVKTCEVGQRAVVLLDEMTMQKEKRGYAKPRAFAEETLQHNDPVKHLMDCGLSRDAAKARIKYWKKAYPDLFDGVIITFVDHAQAEKKEPYKMRTSEELFEEYKNASASPDPTGYLQMERGLKRDSANALWSKLRRRFGSKVIPEKVEEKTIEPTNTSDEMSLEEFIGSIEQENAKNDKEMGQEAASDASVKEIITETKEIKEDPFKGQRETWTKEENAYGELGAMFYKVERETEQVKSEIAKLEARLKWLNEMQESLTNVAKLLNMATTK